MIMGLFNPSSGFPYKLASHFFFGSMMFKNNHVIIARQKQDTFLPRHPKQRQPIVLLRQASLNNICNIFIILYNKNSHSAGIIRILNERKMKSDLRFQILDFIVRIHIQIADLAWLCVYDVNQSSQMMIFHLIEFRLLRGPELCRLEE